MTIRERYEHVLAIIAAAAERRGRAPGEITVVAVSKKFDVPAILTAADQGITDFGENRAQEFRSKYKVVGDRVRWHFVGHLQTNKVKYVVGNVGLIHSVDRIDAAEAIGKRALTLGIDQPVLVEVNIARDPTKHGVDPASLPDLIARMEEVEGVTARGLMAMAPIVDDPEDARVYFKELAALRDRLASPGLVELSMGMSGDYEVAVEEGATIVRIGEAIFGPRNRKDVK